MSNLPAGFAEKYRRLLGPEADAFLASFDQPAEKGFRLNPLHGSDLPTPAATDQVPWNPLGYYGSVGGSDRAFWTGAVYSQEPSAMAVAPQLQAKPGERVLDLAAAPGGKTTDLIGQMQDTGLLVSNDIDRSRAKILSENVERWGAAHTVVTSAPPAKLMAAFPHFFDRILLDAPCSGEGMFRKDPAAMGYWHPDYPAECAARQQDILKNTIPMLADDAELVYSTCTFSPEEDEEIIAWLLATYPGLSVVPIPLVGGMTGGRPDWADGNPSLQGCARLFPQLVRGEGHFVAHLHYHNSAAAPVVTAAHKKRRTAATGIRPLTRAENDLFTTFWRATMVAAVPAGVAMFGQQIVALPPAFPDRAAGLTILRPGLIIADVKRDRLVPNHALAMALPASAWRYQEALTDAAAARYRHGETVPTETPGRQWGVLTTHGVGFAVGHFVNGTVKNFYPKGLRI
ncbi:RsmB/NOP family class I SAM-dependent RNA methyltransferase [Schleiferilactobacillus harbinensis]|uniref:RsmB/NOP family class I SAM-dependent RNA methyltransferase n=1 Tax=Schleiferilactobacillus harbinensis TaxID=304207 RepID=UPI001AAF8892|nr:RsmF rRNA methyltransferase first C-terminal domain-containing protein [Schleiferilactobacillus harbinensis]MBO3092064.1 RsmB/NOP family class I SAM-dependent RNA methyltransferase [Schleiferilactobacillus harbinensis]